MFKAVPYERTQYGVQPVAVTAVRQQDPRAAANGSTQSQPQSPTKTVGSLKDPRASALSEADDVKRDSGIAPSLPTTTDRAACAESQQIGVARSPTLPTVMANEDEPPGPIKRSRSPFSRKKSREQARPPSPLPPPPSGPKRVRSFKGIKTEIPRTTFDDIGLEDLASDKVEFSQRGSLMFGGKKMGELIAAQGDGVSQSNGVVQPIGTAEDEKPVSAEESKEEQPSGPTTASESPSTGLVSGRRKPSVHLLQALQNGRVLSAEEIAFSMKVRSMYEAGDERAAEWVAPRDIPQDRRAPPLSNRATPDIAVNDEKVVSSSNGPAENGTARPPSSQDARRSYIRESKELAGGLEDWNEVTGQDVDRYGFIKPQRDSSRPSTTEAGPPGLHRVASALRIDPEQNRRDRKLQRGISNARSARSVPARPSRDGPINKAPGSIHSFRSSRSAHGPATPFFSKDRRTLADAADMLLLPPGLSDIAEQDDSNRGALTLKRREWSRNDKWQKMARPVRESANAKGGGMRFEFDTNDPKLISRTWKGIPDRWRATAWHSFILASAKRRGKYVTDEKLIAEYHRLQDENCADDVQIDVDVPRTISMHIMFRRRYRGGQRLLFRILHAISLYCPEPGYVQGMASLAATLLCYYDEEQAFVMMVRLWQLRGLEQLFQSEFVGLIAALNEFERDWLHGGDVAQKLEELGIPSTSYGTRWYLTLFHLSIPFPAQLRVWDVFMLLGDAPIGGGKDFGGADLDVLHAVSAALIDATRDILLDADFENAMKVLTSFLPIKDEDLLMRVTRTEWKLRKKRIGIS